MTGPDRARGVPPALRPRAWTVALAAIAWGIASAALAAQTVNPQAAALLEFQKHLDAYVQLRERAVADVPKLKETPSPTDIDERERAMARAIRAARINARPGDLVAPAERLLRKIVRDDWARRSAAERRGLAVEIPRVGRIFVNNTYPSGLPLATMPPALLQELPRLPEALEYRLIGRALILRDVSSNLIVDFVEKALPSR